MKSSRAEKIQTLVSARQLDVQLILDRVHDMHNIGAVMRTCDAVGLSELDILFDQLRARRKMRLGKLTSAGARKWVSAYGHLDHQVALSRKQWSAKPQIIAASHHPKATSLHELNLTLPTILIMGNEHDGVRPALIEQADHIVSIPQYGLVESLNISVACAVILYEMLRQRQAAGMYINQPMTDQRQALQARYEAEHNKNVHGRVRMYRPEAEEE